MSPVAYVFIGFFILLPLVALWVYCIAHMIARPDLKLFQKALWIVAIIVFPFIGSIVYLFMWRRHGPIDETKAWEDKSAEEIEQAVWQSENMSATDRISHTRLQ
jgi:type VI protein secretion system component VasK